MSDATILKTGYETLFNALGAVDAEKFIALVNKDRFDYTKWQESLWHGKSVNELYEESKEWYMNTNPQGGEKQ